MEENYDEIKINPIQLACDLAHKETVKELIGEGFRDEASDDELEQILVWDEDNECSTYTEEAQEVFDKHYDYWMDLLLRYGA